jgi:hypothetical protein
VALRNPFSTEAGSVSGTSAACADGSPVVRSEGPRIVGTSGASPRLTFPAPEIAGCVAADDVSGIWNCRLHQRGRRFRHLELPAASTQPTFPASGIAGCDNAADVSGIWNCRLRQRT